ncbi:hypothetical protein K3495_g3522 [Podosphaera aphanis]|nr:hypothetical protein K3495_g3522 [Podosphaera aphanis]
MLVLNLTADMTGVTELRPDDTTDNPFWYSFKVQCTSCREVHPTCVKISRFEANEMSGSRGEANFVWRCKFCKREASASILTPPTTYQYESSTTRQTILEVDCRGLELVEFFPEGEWLATGLESKSKFEAIDLTDGEWFDYDEKSGEEVSVRDLKWEIGKK